jgi:hypothetical protein
MLQVGRGQASAQIPRKKSGQPPSPAMEMLQQALLPAPRIRAR